MAKELIYGISSIKVVLLDNHAPSRSGIRIEVIGLASTSGWSGQELVLVSTTHGIYEYEFRAQRPGGIVHQTIVELPTAIDLDPKPADLIGIKVRARVNGLP